MGAPGLREDFKDARDPRPIGMIRYAADGTAVIALDGEYDSVNANDILAEVREALESGALNVILDMAQATFIDSTALSAMVSARRESEAARIRLSVANPSVQVARILALTGMTELFLP